MSCDRSPSFIIGAPPKRAVAVRDNQTSELVFFVVPPANLNNLILTVLVERELPRIYNSPLRVTCAAKNKAQPSPTFARCKSIRLEVEQKLALFGRAQ